MGKLCEVAVLSLLILALLNTQPTLAKKSSSSSSRKSSSSNSRGGTQSKPASSKPGSYPRQPQSPSHNNNPYPPGGSYPYPGAGGSPNQYPGRANPGGKPAGGYPAAGGVPNQNPAAGGYPAGGYPAGGYPAGGYPAGGYPAGRYPAGGYPAGGYPNQSPGRNYPNQYPAAGGYPNQRSPYQYPAGGGYPAAGGGYPAAGGGYPGAGGGYPAAGGYPNQRFPYQYPAGGGYPVRGGNTGQGWGQPVVNPGSYPGGAIGGYPNWNPNNRILSPSFGGGGYGYGSHRMGGSPFSRSVQTLGYQPKSTSFAKKAVMAAGVGAVAGMAIGYGLGRFPRPHFSFRNPEEEHYYNNYMYRRYGSQSTDEKDYGRDYAYVPPPRAESYDNFMSRCMNRTDLLKAPASSSPPLQGQDRDDEDNDDTVSIEEIGYPALIEQMKARRCVEQFMVYSERFLQERKAEQQMQPRGSSPQSYGALQTVSSLLVLLSSMILLQ